MPAASRLPRRAGFTLVELTVVIGIIVILLAIGAAFLPGLQANQKVQTGVDRVAQWLLIAKNRAKHDGLPTGLRFVVTNTPTADAPPIGGYQTVSQFMYVQQPDFLFGDPGVTSPVSAFTVPDLPLTTPPTYNTPQSQVLFTNNPDFIGGDASNPLVQLGDYLELLGGGTLYQILQVTTAVNPADGKTYVALQLNPAFPGATVPGAPGTVSSGSTTSPGTTNWRIIRQPRRVPGEDLLTLPQDIFVDLSIMPPPSPPPPIWTQRWSQNVPSRGVNVEIMFSPSGGVIAQTAQTGKILLWVRDATVPSPSQGDSPPLQGNPTLVSIQVRSGFIGTYPVVPNTDPTQYPGQFYTDALRGRSGF
jgi:prepilin-type N-terminal cleavage/methylation domain-containing protein